MGKLQLSVAILLILCVTIIHGDQPNSPDHISQIKGRPLTPEEGCGYSKVAHRRIVGGSQAKNGAWPWIALLGYRVFKRDGEAVLQYVSYTCGGSLISSRHVLTAAHCIEPSLVTVRLGEYDMKNKNEAQELTIRVAFTEPHKLFHLLYGVNDIGIVFMEKSVEFTDYIRPICLPTGGIFEDLNFVGKTPFVAGWGKNGEEKTAIRPPILQEVQVPVLKNEDCKEKYKLINEFKHDIQFSRAVLCAGLEAGGKDTCKGDSGGPMMLPAQVNGTFRYFQIGVISYGIGCGRPNVPGIYANVSFYNRWIHGKLTEFLMDV